MKGGRDAHAATSTGLAVFVLQQCVAVSRTGFFIRPVNTEESAIHQLVKPVQFLLAQSHGGEYGKHEYKRK
jgi:hypothetical protein